MYLLKKNITGSIFIFSLVVFSFCTKKPTETIVPPVTPPPGKTFTNPLLSGSDPWIYKQDSFYYYTQTSGNKIVLWKTKLVSALSTAPFSTIFSPTPGTANSSNIWAPEIYFFDGKWYTYYTAGNGQDSTQRLWVLENGNADPSKGSWTDKGRIYAADANFWSIDGTVLDYNGQRYFIWSGRPVSSIQNQHIYIAKMSNPWTLVAPSVLLSKPDLPWEKIGGDVNEAPEILKNDQGKIFLIYSASGCWTDDYSLGMLSLREGADPMDISNWTKEQQPVFTKQPQNNAYGPGHCTFFKSKSGTEDWIMYHANNNSDQGCSVNRNVRMQKITWNTDGTPALGVPVKTAAALAVPAGE